MIRFIKKFRSLPKVLFVFLLLFCATRVYSATCTAVSGIYSNTSTWSCGHVPQSGDNVIIPAGVTVEVDITTVLLSNTNFYVFGILNFDNAAKIKLDCNSSVWVEPPTGELTGGNGGSKIEYCGDPNAWTGGQTTNGPFTIGTSPLPIELLSFTGTPNSVGIELNWSTASETNNSFFTIERTTDGTNFTMIATVSGSGTTSAQHDYLTEDYSPVAGFNYYRLTQTDINGQSEQFPLIAVEYSPGQNCEMFVVPDQDGNYVVTIPGCTMSSAPAMDVIDVSGRVIATLKPAIGPNDSFVYTLHPVAGMNTGIYFIQVATSSQLIRQEFILR
ncbi:MAG TPA: G8 domain-containing protein [Bacteroidia bacterium]|jgi:hypothetical protein|nr:G8 domain-containing protein [Bacteroidia bacterium]